MDREKIGQAKNRETKEVRTINDNLTREASVARAKMDRLRRVDRTRINVCETINGAEVFLPNIYKKRCESLREGQRAKLKRKAQPVLSADCAKSNETIRPKLGKAQLVRAQLVRENKCTNVFKLSQSRESLYVNN